MRKYILTRHSKTRFQERTILNRSKEMQDKFRFAVRKGIDYEMMLPYNPPEEIKDYMREYGVGKHKKYYKGLIFVYYKAKNSKSSTLMTVYECWNTYIDFLESVYNDFNNREEKSEEE